MIPIDSMKKNTRNNIRVRGLSDHHTTLDKIDLIDFDHLYKAAKLLYPFIIELGNEQQSSETNKTKKTDN